MAKRLFVGGLSYTTDEETLKASFSQFGTVEKIHIPVDKETGKPRGFAFIDMATEEGAERAMETLDGSELDGRRMSIKEAIPMERPPRRPQNGSWSSGQGGGGRY